MFQEKVKKFLQNWFSKTPSEEEKKHTINFSKNREELAQSIQEKLKNRAHPKDIPTKHSLKKENGLYKIINSAIEKIQLLVKKLIKENEEDNNQKKPIITINSQKLTPPIKINNQQEPESRLEKIIRLVQLKIKLFTQKYIALKNDETKSPTRHTNTETCKQLKVNTPKKSSSLFSHTISTITQKIEQLIRKYTKKENKNLRDPSVFNFRNKENNSEKDQSKLEILIKKIILLANKKIQIILNFFGNEKETKQIEPKKPIYRYPAALPGKVISEKKHTKNTSKNPEKKNNLTPKIYENPLGKK